jgi:hypothetical protein
MRQRPQRFHHKDVCEAGGDDTGAHGTSQDFFANHVENSCDSPRPAGLPPYEQEPREHVEKEIAILVRENY